MEIKNLKELIERFNDDDEVAIEINQVLYDCYGYDDDYTRKKFKVSTLVIAKE